VGRATTVVDPLGNVTKNLYNLKGQVSVTTDALGNRTFYTYTGMGLVSTITDPQGNVTSYQYDALGRVTHVTNPDGSTTGTAYDAIGEVTWASDPTGTTTSQYDVGGNVTKVTDPRGIVTLYDYDADNRQTTIVTASGTAQQQTSSVAYDPVGNVTSSTNPNGKVTLNYFDAANQLTKVTDPMSQSTQTGFNAVGDAISTTDALGKVTQYAFDTLDRLTKTTDPNGNSTKLSLDAVGNQVGSFDGAGDLSQDDFDGDGEDIESIDPDGYATKRQFDANNNLTSLTDASGNTTGYQYNTDSELVVTTDPLGNKTTDTYDVEGRLSTTTDADNRETSYAYDGDSNLLSASDVNGTITYGYDNQNRETKQTDVYGIVLNYSYDNDNNVTARTDSLGGTLNMVYNNDDLETSEQFSGTGLTPLRADFGYTARNDLSTITRYSNVAGTTLVGTASYTYDYGERLTAIDNYSSTGVTESYYDYAYDSADRVTTETWSSITATTTLSGMHNTSYDADSQITSADGVAQTYDATGNRTTTGYSTGTGNRLLNDGTYSYTYDNVGNRISKVASGSSPDTWSYAYDQNNRLTSVIEKSNGTTVNFQATYTYDVVGNLIREDTWSSTAGSATVKHTYDGNTLIADLNSSLAVQTRYFYDPNGNVVAELTGSTVNWAGTDRLGSVRDMFGSTGTVTAHVEYTDFGVVTTNTAPIVAGNVLFQGMYQQAVTLNDVTQNRIYDPFTGRWLTTDPDGFGAGDDNLYRFVGNDSTNATDPSGSIEEPIKPMPPEAYKPPPAADPKIIPANVRKELDALFQASILSKQQTNVLLAAQMSMGFANLNSANTAVSLRTMTTLAPFNTTLGREQGASIIQTANGTVFKRASPGSGSALSLANLKTPDKGEKWIGTMHTHPWDGISNENDPQAQLVGFRLSTTAGLPPSDNDILAYVSLDYGTTHYVHAGTNIYKIEITDPKKLSDWLQQFESKDLQNNPFATAEIKLTVRNLEFQIQYNKLTSQYSKEDPKQATWIIQDRVLRKLLQNSGITYERVEVKPK
jgi:RHS repeat-associated protein